MRDVLTGLAVAIITLLSLALVGPLFIDWTGQRSRIEALLADTIGARVQIGGAIDVRLLPTPRLIVERAQIGERPGPSLGADRIAIEIATMPLLKGEVRILESRITGARFQLTRLADGGFALPNAPHASASVQKLFINDARLQIRDASGQLETDLFLNAIEADAGSLAGPWRVTGRLRDGATQRELRLALGAAELGQQRVRLSLTDENGRSDFDGRLDWALGLIEGRGTRQGRLPWPLSAKEKDTRPYSISAQMRITPRDLRADALEIEAGADDGVLKLSGSVEGSLNGLLNVKLEGKSLDLDRPLRQGDGAPLDAAAALAAWAGVFDVIADEAPAFTLDLALSQLILGGDALRSVSLKADMRDTAWRIVDLNVDAPGSTVLSARGDLAFGATSRFSGSARIETRDPARFAVWLEGEKGRARFPLRADLRAEADIFITRDVIAASKLSLTYGPTSVTGAARLQSQTERPRLEAQLVSDRFALESLPDMTGVSKAFGDLDALISLEVRQLDLGQEWRGGRLRLRVEKLAGRVALPLFELSDQAGLAVRATGNLQGEGGRLDASLDLPQLAPVLVIAKRLYGGPVIDALSARAAQLSPFRGRVALHRDQEAYRIEANGRAVSTDLAFALRVANDAVDGTFEMRAPDVTGLMKQAGLNVVPLALNRSMQARIAGTIKGPARAPIINARFEAGQTRLSVEGSLLNGPFAGTLRGESDDLTPWLQWLALPAPPIGERLPLTIRADLRGGDGLNFDRFEARFGQQRLSGQFTVKEDRVNGALEADDLSFETLAALTLGPIAPSLPGSVWPSQRFMPIMPPNFRASFRISAPFMTLPFGLRGDRPRFDLAWSQDGLSLSDAQFGFAGGEWRGQLTLKRQGSLASLSARTQWNGVDLATLLPASGLSGKAQMTLDLGASGESIAAMVNTLSGGGRLRIEDGAVARLDARRVMPVIAQADQGRDAIDPRQLRDLVLKAIDSGPLTMDPFETTLGVSNGVVRMGPALIQAAFVQGQASVLYDLKTSRVDGRLTLQAAGQGLSDWATPPQWSVQWRSLPNGAVTRDLDVATLSNVLTTRFVARELQRIEAEEADLRERNFFIRRQRSEKMRYEEQIRQEELKRAEAEAQKAKEEAERLLKLIPPPMEPAAPALQ